MKVKRGELYYVNFGNISFREQSSLQKGIRPAIVLQNDIGNEHSTTTIVAPLTTRQKHILPTHIDVDKDNINNLRTNSTILLEQITTIDKYSIIKKIGIIEDEKIISKINFGLLISVGIKKFFQK